MADVFSNEFSIKVEDMDMKGFKLKGGVQKDEPKNHFSAAELYHNGKDVKCHIFWNRDCGFPPMVKWLSDADKNFKSSLVRGNNVALGVEKALDELWTKKFKKSPWCFQKPAQQQVIQEEPKKIDDNAINSAASVIAGAIDFGDDEIVYDDEEYIEVEQPVVKNSHKKVNIWTDGACSGNGKDNAPGGYGILFKMGEHTRQLSGFDPSTTNNRMELMGAIVALETLKYPCDVELRSDSKYLVDGANQWLQGWIKKNWKTASGDPVKNQDLWMRLLPLLQKHNVVFVWEKGHDPVNNPENAICDGLATSEYLKRR